MRLTRFTALFLAATSAASAQTYSYDDGSTENAFTIDGLAEIGYLHAFNASGSDAIGEIRAALGTALAPAGGLDGNMIRVAIWDDPNNDGDPSDATLLFESATMMATQTNTDVKVSYPISPAVAVTGGFFVGVITDANPNEFPVGLDQSAGSNGAAFAVGDTAGIDATNLSASSNPPFAINGAQVLVDAIGGGSGGINTNYCSPAQLNSTGFPGAISATGSIVAANNDVTLTASMLPTFSFGLFITSQTQGFVMNPGGSQGDLCVAGTIGRFAQQIQSSGAQGVISIDTDLTALPQPNGTVAVMAGDTWNFQCWYRDANPMTTSNFTDAISVDFQ